MENKKYTISQTLDLVSELKQRFSTLNGYLKGDIQNLENIKEVCERRNTFQMEKLQIPVGDQLKKSFLRNVVLCFCICLIVASIIVYAGLFDFTNLFPQMSDIASAIHFSAHTNNVLFDWVLPISITTLILLLVSVVVVGLLVLPIAKVCDNALTDIHSDTSGLFFTKQLVYEVTTNTLQLSNQFKDVNKVLDSLIKSTLSNEDFDNAKYLESIKADLLTHAILYNGYYNLLLARISK